MARQSSLEKPKLNIHQLAGNVEHDLFESLIVEYNDVAGFEVWYYVRDESAADLDDLYGESAYQNTSYKNRQKTKILYEVTEEATLTTGFGINSEDVVQYGFMPKHTYNRDVAQPLWGINALPTGDHQPRPGDVIKTIWNNRAYEVVDVHEESHIFQANKAIWEFILKPYRFSEESASASAISPFNRPPTENRDKISSMQLSAYGNNEFLEDQSDIIYDYADENVDTSIYGY
jgi:hypothetical protein